MKSRAVVAVVAVVLLVTASCRSPAAPKPAPAEPPAPAAAPTPAGPTPAAPGPELEKAPAPARPKTIADPRDLRPPPDGPRAPKRSGFGVEIAKATYADIQKLTAEKKLGCSDTSIRALMEAAKAKQAEGVDAVTSASKAKKSPHADDPYIRFACGTVSGTALGDRARPSQEGRLLFTFDAKETPLRHVSFRRSHRTAREAVQDATDTIASITAVYGKPTTAGALPELPKEGAAELPSLTLVTTEWNWADFRVKVSLFASTTGGVDVDELFEVPWPIQVVPPAP